MKTNHLPRHIEEHVKHCAECERKQTLCYEAAKLLREHKIVADKIAKLPLLSSYAKKP